MKRAVFLAAMGALAAPAAAAQWAGVPMWNSPKGSAGVTLAADYARSNMIGSTSNAFAGRVSLGNAAVTLTAGLSTWKPERFARRALSYGGAVAFRLVDGSRVPVALNLQLGGAHNPQVTSGADTLYETTTANAALGISVPMVTPVVSIEPYFSPGVRYHKYWNVAPGVSADKVYPGWVIGGNVAFGPLGIHLAYDSEMLGSGRSRGLFGAGAHVSIKVPIGM